VPTLPYADLAGAGGEPSSAVAARVLAARRRQEARAATTGAATHADLDGRAARATARLEPEAERLLGRAVDRLALTGRAHDRLLRVARTIADLEAAPSVGAPHLAEALQLRCGAAASVAEGGRL
jgi:magnesium chelatase family protein